MRQGQKRCTFLCQRKKYRWKETGGRGEMGVNPVEQGEGEGGVVS